MATSAVDIKAFFLTERFRKFYWLGCKQNGFTWHCNISCQVVSFTLLDF